MGSLKFKTTHIICVLVLFFIGLPFGFGQTTSFKTKLSKNSVSTGERFEVIFELNSNGGNFKPPSLKGFKILSGPNKSTSIQMINGQVSSKLTYSYVLMAAEVGELTIGAASIKVGAQELKTEPVTLTVTKGSAVKPSNTNTGQNSNNKPDIADNLFIKLFVNKSKAFTGEQITATYKIYTRLSIVDNEVNTLPSFNGFWTQDVDLPQHTALRNEVLNGVPYQVATIKKVILFPQRSGKLKVDPMSLDVVVRIPQRSSSRNIFDQFFGRYKDVKYTISSNAQTINVKALPSNAPEAFDGAVGNYSFSAVIDKNEIETNDAINLKLTLSGQGNIKTLEDLDIDFPSDFEVYDPKIKDQINTTNGILSGKRTYEYLIIPRHAGEFTIDPIQFSYFDPKSKKYVDLSSGQFDIKVLKGENDASPNVSFHPGNKKEVEILAEDIKFIKTETEVDEIGGTFLGSIPFIFTLLLPWMLFMLFVFYKKNNQSNANKFDERSKKANKVATTRLTKAKEFVEKQDPSAFYDAIYQALFGYFSDRFNIPLSQLSISKIAEESGHHNIDESTINKLTNILNDCEMSKFAPLSNSDLQTVYSNTSGIITEIESSLK